MKRISKVTPFVSSLETDRKQNLAMLVARAKRLSMLGFETVEWGAVTWVISDGKLSASPGKRKGDASINFMTAPKLGGAALEGSWAEAAKSLMCLRFHRKSSSMSSQRNFVTALGYVAHIAGSTEVWELKREVLDRACALIASHYSETSAYNLYKALHEFTDYCDANFLCNVSLRYRYHAFSRPSAVNSREQTRLDDAQNETTKAEKMVSPEVLQALGVLFLDVPKDHNLRIYVVMLTFLAFMGRRFSELAMMPFQLVGTVANGERYIYTFPGKAKSGDDPSVKRRVFIPTKAEEVIEQCVQEFSELSQSPRETAKEMRRCEGPDVRFVPKVSEDYRFYSLELSELGIPNLVGANGWARKNALAFPDFNKLTLQGIRPANPSHYVTRSGIVAYCQSLYNPRQIEWLIKDSEGTTYFPENLLLLRFMGLSSGMYSRSIAQPISHAMLQRFIKVDIHPLVAKFVSSDLQLKFTSHQFRHTLNTLLDEGGLSELMQTRWFNRTNPRDTKAYQHSSPAKKALMYREMIKLGEVGGPIADTYHQLPVTQKDAFLIARVRAIHDLGPGFCTHSFAQSPCPKGLECQAECNEFSWVKTNEDGRAETIRLYKTHVVQVEAAASKYSSKRKGESEQWLAHATKKLGVMERQLLDYGVDPHLVKMEALASE